MEFTDNFFKLKWFIKDILFVLIFMIIGFLAVYGGYQLYDRSDRIDLIESQRSRIESLETKVCFLENTDYAMIIQQLPMIIQDDLAALNEKIKQDKHARYEATEQPIIDR